VPAVRPAPSSENARQTMRANRRVSRREVAFRRALWEAGARGYRLDSRLPGRPDLVFPRLHLAVFVHGCFWHRCLICNPATPKANADFWADKFADNVRRDQRTQAALTDAGWTCLVIWEHEIRPDPAPRAGELAAVIRELRAPYGSESK
jgi:DNA mismatch endonuclease (patch repair protein)